MDTVLFDLDGTLLPMDQDEFVRFYFKLLVKKFVPMGFDAEELVKAVNIGTVAMVKNDGTMTNKERFWTTFAALLGDEVREKEELFNQFYANEFNLAAQVTGRNALAKICVEMLKSKDYRLILATNPLFPPFATYNRIRWAGLSPTDFELITNYENCCYCKPSLAYYQDILHKIGRKPEDCLMIGNDITEDMCAGKLGMSVFWLNDCVNDKEKYQEKVNFPQGGFGKLQEYISKLPLVC